MRIFFIRDNAFKMILFTSMLLMALYHFFFNGEFVSQITSFLGLLIFILSILNMSVSVLEKLIEHDDWEIEYIYSCFKNDQNKNIYAIAEDIASCDKVNLCNIINKYNKIDIEKDSIVKYWFVLNHRRNTRIIRRIFLYLYFATITVILVFLFLSHELLPYIQSFNFGDWTILSFVIILFEILIKDEISEGIYWSIHYILTKKCDKLISELEDINNG